MRSFHRLAIVLAAIVIFSGTLITAARAQQFDSLFTKARELEKAGRKRDALTEYNRVAREHSREPEAAAEALYLAGEMARQGFGSTDQDKRDGQDAAVQAWKQISIDYPTTAAGRKLLGDRQGGPNDQLAALENQIDKRNSSDPKYKILDTLVALTGRNPSFSYALALILLALLVKLILFPLTIRQYASMREMQRMQPHIKALQEKYKGKSAELNQKTMELYKEHGVNPFAGCWPALIQLPFLIFVFTAIREYEFAFTRGKFLWIGSSLADQGWKVMGYDVIGKNLASPDIILLALYAITNFITMKMTPASDPVQQQQQNSMAWMMSLVFFFMFVTYRWSSAFVLYWLALNVFSIWQQYEFIYKPHKERLANGVVSPAAAAAGPNGAAAAPADAKPVGQPERVKPRKKKKK